VSEESALANPRYRLIVLGVIPLLLLAVVLALFVVGGSVMLSPLTSSVPPIESVSIDRVVLREEMIIVTALNSGPTEVTISQVLVNDAIWDATVYPNRTIPRLGTVTITIPYHWVEGEPVEVALITSNGFVFHGGVEAATLTPEFSLPQVGALASIGVYVGIIPVFIGLAWLPFLRYVREKWYSLLLSLTAGLLVFLAVDAFGEAIELTAKTPGPFQGLALVVVTTTLTFLVLEMVGGRSIHQVTSVRGRAATVLVLAYLVALGIGLHNLGEGLLIGAAYALGEVALGAFLILGFTIHNATEGFAIVAPISSGRTQVRHVIAMGLIAGAPTIFGAWIGGFVFSNLWALVFLAIGVGAIVQVVYEVVSYMAEGASIVRVLSRGTNLLGLILGFALAYATALLIP
jgi:zinc transporter ZupT